MAGKETPVIWSLRVFISSECKKTSYNQESAGRMADLSPGL